MFRERNLIDGLTGLYNKKYLDEFIDKKMPVELSKGTTYAVMFLDIDYFKMINDTYGHDAGDAILQKLSKTMKIVVTENEFIIRFVGEEFLIIMKNPTEESALELATKINYVFSKLVFTFNNESFSKTVNIVMPSSLKVQTKSGNISNMLIYVYIKQKKQEEIKLLGLIQLC